MLPCILLAKVPPLPFLQEFHQLLDLHKQDPELDIQVMLRGVEVRLGV